MSGLSQYSGVPATSSSTRLSMAAGACLVLSASGCIPWVGPIHVSIESGDPPVDDFVIETGKIVARLHHNRTVYLETRAVSSQEELLLPRVSRGPSFVGIVVAAYHPQFRSAQSRLEPQSGGTVELKSIRPTRWSDYLAAGGTLDVERFYNHLYTMRVKYIPTFEVGPARRRLQRYLPGLVDLAERAELSAGDLQRWGTEEEARRVIDDELAAISELLR